MGGQSPAAAPILNTANVFKHFGEVHAVDGVDLHIAPGEVLSIVGPNGAGKTTLLKLLSGGHELDRGQVFFLGEDISRVRAIAAPSPRPIPTPVSTNPCRKNIPLTVFGWAPRAIRIPISLVRCETV